MAKKRTNRVKLPVWEGEEAYTVGPMRYFNVIVEQRPDIADLLVEINRKFSTPDERDLFITALFNGPIYGEAWRHSILRTIKFLKFLDKQWTEDLKYHVARFLQGHEPPEHMRFLKQSNLVQGSKKHAPQADR